MSRTAIFPFEMPIGALGRVVSPAEYADQGMTIERVSADRWERRDVADPAWHWTAPAPGAAILVELEAPPELPPGETKP